MTNPVPPNETPVSPPTTPPSQPAQPQALSDDAQRLYDYFKLIDPNQEGVGLDKVRPIYPKVGWNVVLADCKALEDRNMLTKRKVSGPSGRGGYDLYTWR